MAYGDTLHLRTGESILAQAPSASHGAPIWLIHIPAGVYPAGSGTRQEPESWAVVSVLEGRRNSRSFTDKGAKARGEDSGLASARVLWERWTVPAKRTWFKREC